VKKPIVLTLAAMFCAGCSGLSVGPARVHSLDEQVASLKANYPLSVVPASPQGLYDYVTERMFEIDLQYTTYFASLTRDSQIGSLGGDAVLLTLTGLSTVAPASAVAYKTAYSAAATGVAGFKTAIDQDVLLSHTIQILQSQMESSRTLIRGRIMANLDGAVHGKPYTVWQALSDLEDYYRAGTIPGALEALAAVAGNNAQQTKDLKNGATQNGQPVKTTMSGQTANGVNVRTLKAP
jgi:hypothetical protein